MDPIVTLSLKQQAYQRVRHEILRGELPPGTRIRERDLAERLGISRTPIREALVEMAAEGLVVFLPRRGIVVSDPTVDEVEEIYALLGVLEGYAAAKVIRSMTNDELRELRRLTEALADSVRLKDTMKFMEINSEIHNVFLQKYPGSHLREICAKLREPLYQARVRLLSSAGWMEQSLREHKELLRVFERRDARKIERLIRRHWRFKETRRDMLERIIRAVANGSAASSDLHTPREAPPARRRASHRSRTTGEQ
jgi:DNA-binding GntR family transcriptional regulator